MKEKLLGNLKKGLAVVLSAPAGTGKTTLIQMLKNEFDCVIPSISFTSRPPRPNEVDGRDYNFITEDQFKQKIEEGEFLEYVELYGFYYGTSKRWVEEKLDQGKHVFLVIDTQGAKQLRGHFPAIFIFLKPPSLEELKSRLSNRKTETFEMLEKRLNWAVKEMEAVKYYDYLVMNDDLTIAYQVLRSILIAEERKLRY
jgi:guanylate kinase